MKKSFIIKRKGFTLVEVILAMVIIAFTMAIFSKVIYTGFKASNSNKKKLQCIIIAQNYMEKLRGFRDYNEFNTIDSLKRYLIQKENFKKNDNILKKEEVHKSVRYSISISIDEDREVEKELFDKLAIVSVKVKSQNNNEAQLKTKFYLMDNNSFEGDEKIE
ncbi:type IV pilus modification PilV family protein [Clostridium rectalis]|uniref:type IV pilus modification PilV family protein n=1 Tax=Clostridium rectalis TaxID=2040295 RepID=UPI000F6426FC|nr:type II secretion system protein [Clostridium rectalis]